MTEKIPSVIAIGTTRGSAVWINGKFIADFSSFKVTCDKDAPPYINLEYPLVENNPDEVKIGHDIIQPVLDCIATEDLERELEKRRSLPGSTGNIVEYDEAL